MNDISFSRVYLEDIVVTSKEVSDHAKEFLAILKRIKNTVLRLKLSNCRSACNEVQARAHIVLNAGDMIDFGKI